MKIKNLLKRAFVISNWHLFGPTCKPLNDPAKKIAELKNKYGKNLMFILWHESIAMPIYFYRGRSLGLLREASEKGDNFAAAVRSFGFKEFGVTDNPGDKVSIRGTIAFIKYLREGGHDGNIAIDGPNGPYHVPKPGVFKIAEKADLLIIPAGVWYSKKIIFKNRWDKFQLPYPFISKYWLEIGEPYYPSKPLNDENMPFLLEEIKNEMEKINERAAEQGKREIAARKEAAQRRGLRQFLRKFFLIVAYYVIGMTARIANDPEPKLAELKKDGKNLIFCVWHEATAGCFWYYRRRKAGILIENSAKGDVLGAMARHFGYKTFGISDDPTDRCSAKGTIQFIKYLREGHDGVIALDGPNGPYHAPKSGVFSIAQKSNALIVPVGCYYDKKVILKKRWDKYHLPKLFSKYVLLVGEPFPIPENLTEENTKIAIAQLAERIDELAVEAAGGC